MAHFPPIGDADRRPICANKDFFATFDPVDLFLNLVSKEKFLYIRMAKS